ncbi:para-aminobenzoate synthase [Aureobasidium melanogenum CBS 110374]|uniref:aminodeoxychorismate synthase n=1 Tax=Aureobasidium melanogenum (strain CBS 110374) TaxID=1043003 RepID=A0A074W177_AURM1|nr:para-aminobenzoate synthase [Aureobasidium melanogenum CBS 110374]KEQ65304.1 para-aminobenzoate synthase [Aureobasidium melanogenum CBS 110374]
MHRPHLLFLDAYDSFSNNIINLLQQDLNATVQVIKIDDKRFVTSDEACFHAFLGRFDAVVAGPGPGDPRNSHDLGLIGKLWHLPEDVCVPVLGICLGFQSLALAFGGTAGRLHQPRHGLVTEVTHQGQSLFKGIDVLMATQYHSLHAKLGHTVDKASTDLWKATSNCPDILPLAWDLSDDQNGPILMGIRHLTKPFYGVQYHPESICTSSAGAQIIHNWWNSSRMGRPTSSLSVSWKCVDTFCDAIDVALLLQKMQDIDQQAIMLESGSKNGKPVRPKTGRFSIIGCAKDSRSIRYSTGNHTITSDLSGTRASYTGSMTDVWSNIESFMAANKATDGSADVPFWGGLVGFVSYEAGLETIDVAQPTNNDRPDVWFVFVSHSIVVDHVEKKVYIQSLEKTDDHWFEKVEGALKQLIDKPGSQLQILKSESGLPSVAAPAQEEYVRRVKTCQNHIRAGDSYELCLTDQSIISYGENAPPRSFELYQRLRAFNPAPFGAYLRLQEENEQKKNGVTILSSSPERFLSWSRAGKCQFRPIKGTVEKKNGLTRKEAEALLNVDKERAENLMIVDLIRHDLHGVVGSGNVKVEKLMAVEEYQTVFQLVSVIEGQLQEGSRHTGIDVLAASLPPGSMTGAPKKRSCELLTEIEGKPRGIYSGVLGYFDVGGGGDFSVVIRTAFRWDDEGVWRVGAGGAVTVLSSPQAEFEEMDLKRQSCLPLFGHRRDPVK